MTAREWHVTWRSIIVPLLAPEIRTWTARVKPNRRRDEKWQPFDQRKTAWEVD